MVTGYYPETLKEACELRKKYEDSLIISGGTDVMVVKKKAEHTIFINHVPEMKEIRRENGRVRIGAALPYVDILADKNVPEVLKKAIRNIASPAVRNAGTIGGNICNASPAGDTLPVLYALDAVVIKASMKEGSIREIRLPIQKFVLGIRKTELSSQELVVAVEIPETSYELADKVVYEKVGARKSEAISKVSFIGILKIEQNVIEDIRIAFGAVGITALRYKDLEHQIIGKTIEEVEQEKEKFVRLYLDRIHPIDDQRSTAVYRKKVCRNLLQDFLTLSIPEE